MFKAIKVGALSLALAMVCQITTAIPVCAKGLYGDLNGDDAVNAIDFGLLKKHLLGIGTPLDDNGRKFADVNLDSNINVIDFGLFRNYMLGIIDTLPYVAPTPTVSPTPTINPSTSTPQCDWITFVPQPQDVGLKLVIDKSTSEPKTYIMVNITFRDGGYRIADEGKLEFLPTDDGEQHFISTGVKIEKYVGSGSVTQALMNKQIKYPINMNLRDKNHFEFMVEDTTVTTFSFTQNSIIPPEPIPFGATVNKDFVNGNTQFAANIFQKFSDKDSDKNVFFSPFSLSMALSMVYQGADTTTKEEMTETLNYSGMSIEEINQSYIDYMNYFKNLYPQVELNVANSIWAREGFIAKESFIEKNKEVFDAPYSNLDFSKDESCDIMNKWISDSTKGKISKMLNPPISDNIVMYLMNAIYFNGNWAEKFDVSRTKDGTFTNIKGEQKTVPMMNKKDAYKYFASDELKAIELPYGSGNTSMYCILPEADDVNDFISKFDNSKWDEIQSKLKLTSGVEVSIPRFKFEYKPEKVEDTLKELGMKSAFSDLADFSGISDNPMWISEVIHKAVIDVNEEGSEAAAVTIISMAGVSIRPNIEPKTFIADKPFLFLIADNTTGTVLFMGKVVDPSAK